MKKKYMKPQMEVVKIQQTQMLCSSPGSQNSLPYTPNEEVDNENVVW